MEAERGEVTRSVDGTPPREHGTFNPKVSAEIFIFHSFVISYYYRARLRVYVSVAFTRTHKYRGTP